MLSSYMMCTCEVHIWSSHVIYDMHVMWFTVYDLPYMEFTCGFLWNHIQTSKSYTVNHMWFSAYDFRIWFPYMISVYGVHMLFSSMIIYGSVYDHIRKPHVEYLFACGVHMWTFPHVSPHVDLFSLVMLCQVGWAGADVTNWTSGCWCDRADELVTLCPIGWAGAVALFLCSLPLLSSSFLFFFMLGRKNLHLSNPFLK